MIDKYLYFWAVGLMVSAVLQFANLSLAYSETDSDIQIENSSCVKLLSLKALNRAQGKQGSKDVEQWFEKGIEFPPLEISRNLNPREYWHLQNKTFKRYLFEIYGIEAEDRYPKFIRSIFSGLRFAISDGSVKFNTYAEYDKYLKDQGLTVPIASLKKVLDEVKELKDYDPFFSRKLKTFEINQDDPEQLGLQMAIFAGYLDSAFGNRKNAKSYELSIERVSSAVRFNPYTSISSPFESKAAPVELSKELRDGIEGIVKLWNDPGKLLALLMILRNKMEGKMKANSQLTRSEALSEIRNEYESHLGFGSVVTSNAMIENSDWLTLLSEGHPHQDTLTGHAFYYPDEGQPMGGQKVHRNQWLIIMLAQEVYPSLFASFSGLTAQLYKAMGDGNWLYTWGLGSSEYVSYVRNGEFLWKRLFDNSTSIGNTGEHINVPNLPNGSNPSYFVEFFSEYLGVGVND